MTDANHTSDAQKGSPQDAASTSADHKLVADTLALTPGKAHDKPAAPEKKAESSGWSLTSIVSGALTAAESAVSAAAGAAASYLPDLHLTHSDTPAPAANKDTTNKDATSHPPASPSNKPGTDGNGNTDSASAGSKSTILTETVNGKSYSVDIGHLSQSISVDDILKMNGCSTGACTIDQTAAKPFSFGDMKVNKVAIPAESTGATPDLSKATVDKNTWNSLMDYVNAAKSDDTSLVITSPFNNNKSNSTVPSTKPAETASTGKSGTSTGSSEVTPVSKPVTSMPATDTAPAAKPEAGTAVTDKAPAGKPGDAPTGPTGHVEKTTDGYVHKNAAGQVDFERKGPLSIKALPGGGTAALDSVAGVEIKYKPDGTPEGQRNSDGSFTFAGKEAGTSVKIAADNTIWVTKGGKSSHFAKHGNELVLMTEQGSVETKAGTLPPAEKLLDTVNGLFSGKGDIAVYDNGIKAQDANGNQIMVNKDGTATMTIDKHSVLVRNKDGTYCIYHNDGRDTEHLTKEDLNKKLGDSDSAKQLRQTFRQLLEFARTGKMTLANGESIERHADGSYHGKVGTLEAALTTAGQKQIVDTSTGIGAALTPEGKIVATDATTGKEIGTVETDPQKGMKLEGTDLWVNKGVGTTSDGTVFGPQGIKFADGTEFKSNGDIKANDGTTYNTQGLEISWEPPSHTSSSGKSSDDAGAKSDEAKATSQVSAAESMASSILGKVSGGHATAGDIAALLASFDKLGSLVGSLSQMGDSSLMAAAVIAQGTVASSIDVAYSNLNHDIDKAKEITADPTAPAAAEARQVLATA